MAFDPYSQIRAARQQQMLKERQEAILRSEASSRQVRELEESAARSRIQHAYNQMVLQGQGQERLMGGDSSRALAARECNRYPGFFYDSTVRRCMPASFSGSQYTLCTKPPWEVLPYYRNERGEQQIPQNFWYDPELNYCFNSRVPRFYNINAVGEYEEVRQGYPVFYNKYLDGGYQRALILDRVTGRPMHRTL